MTRLKVDIIAYIDGAEVGISTPTGKPMVVLTQADAELLLIDLTAAIGVAKECDKIAKHMLKKHV